MGMPQADTIWTAEMVRALPEDGKRYEVVDGRLLVTPSPRPLHQYAVAQLHLNLDPYVRQHGLGTVLMSPADIELDPRALVQPDVFVTAARLRAWNDGTPLLVFIEVLSPSSARADRDIKRRRYQRAGIPEYWIVDVDARLVERWRPGDTRPEILSDSLLWEPKAGVPPLTLDLPSFFAAVHGEPAPQG